MVWLGKGNGGKSRVRTHLESPWKLQSVLESPWISMLSITPKKKKRTRKDLRDKITRVVEELKQTKSQGSFSHWMESLKNGKCVLEKSLNFLFKKGDEPWKSERSARGGTARNASPLVRLARAFVFSLPLICSLAGKKIASYASLTRPVIGVQIVGISQRDVSRKLKTARGYRSLIRNAAYDKE